jgi:hypothetical protein
MEKKKNNTRALGLKHDKNQRVMAQARAIYMKLNREFF